jgi:murein DD-endopeptidase MepM/ murein hydrolase activator NlpD
MKSLVCLLAMTAMAAAEPSVRIEPKVVHRGDPVLVTVTGVDGAPSGSANGEALQFFRTKHGYQAVVAVELHGDDKPLKIKVGDVERAVDITPVVFAETDVIVEDELANPPAKEREQIAEDNKAMIKAMRSEGEPQFTRAFVRPRGEITSPFGEWRTFNDGHRSQHLGMDVFAKEGSRVSAVNAGTVTLVRDTFLAGKVVVVEHGAGIASAYFHLSEATVGEGDVVTRGQQIGRAGHTGRTTGPHLHLAMRVSGGFVNPATFFKLRLQPAARDVAKR